MDIQTMFNYVAGIAGCAIGWLVRILWDAVKELRKDLAELQKELPDTYVRRDDWRDSMVRIETMVSKIFDRLDGKVDKP